MAERIGILNLDMGNLRSVTNAVYSVGYDPLLVTATSQLDDLTHLVIPGVGSFHTAVERICMGRRQEAVRRFAESRRPVLGLCLGMQLLGSEGEEGGGSRGLELIRGCIVRLDEAHVPAIPHVGWNSVNFTVDHPVFAGVRSGVDFYFVHSYHLVTQDEDCVLGSTDCGQSFASIVGRDNVLGFQFHPEKSQANGLRLLENFCGWDGRC